jgi:hypothetical protein
MDAGTEAAAMRTMMLAIVTPERRQSMCASLF